MNIWNKRNKFQEYESWWHGLDIETEANPASDTP
jgi:hypothetical protein